MKLEKTITTNPKADITVRQLLRNRAFRFARIYYAAGYSVETAKKKGKALDDFIRVLEEQNLL